MTDNALRRLLYGLVATIALLAFVVSFDAIQAYAVRVGAFPHSLRFAAPLLVDTFTLAGTVAIMLRARAGALALYPWLLVAAGSGVSIAINIAHAPHTIPAQAVAALPPVALLASLELVMSEQRKAKARASAEASADSAPTARSREIVRELVRVFGDAADVDLVMDRTGVGRRWAYELLAQVRAENNGHAPQAPESVKA